VGAAHQRFFIVVNSRQLGNLFEKSNKIEYFLLSKKKEEAKSF
jgi:hypothetical protein